jgi:murein DD-endopeptidase MepM/ murein hydrolase activator NlpD
VLLEPDESRRVFRGLLAVDLDRAPGKLALTLAGRDAEDVAFSIPADIRVGARRFPVEKLKVDPALVEPPPEAKGRIEAETRKVAAIWKAPDAERRWHGPFPLPVSAKPSGNFGARRVYNGHERSKHGGVDFPAPVGAAVTAPAPGRVALAEDLYFSGGTVILDHGAGLFTSYFHLSRIDAKAGEVVKEGESLGAVGATGRVTGPHLHWSARLGTARIDPLDLRRLPKWAAK